MKHFKEFIQWCCEPQRLFVLFIVVLAIPNVALFFTEQQMTLWARICNVILPVSVYWLIMTLGRKPGKTIWILFPFVFFAAFQLVLLYLFGRSSRYRICKQKRHTFCKTVHQVHSYMA